MSALTPKATFIAFLIGVLFALSHSSWGGVLEDYQQAHKNMRAGKRPCEMIPYSDLKSECLRKSELVNNNCKIVQWTCEGEMRKLHDTKQLLRDRKVKLIKIKELEKDTNRHKDKLRGSKDENESRNLRKMIEANDREIYDLKRAIEASGREIEVRRGKIQKRIEWAKRCLDNREDVQKVFKRTISKARSESGDNIRSMRDDLINRWEPSVGAHDRPKNEIKAGIRKCEEMRDQRD